MNQVDKILARAKIGQAILDKLNTMKDSEIKNFLRKVIADKVTTHDIIWNGIMTRTIKNEQIESIELCYYDRIEICAFGIKFVPEHRSAEFVIEFDDNFITNAINQELNINLLISG